MSEDSPLDFHPTPTWVVDAIIPHLPRAGWVLDAGCGTGRILGRLLHHRFEATGIEQNDRLAMGAQVEFGHGYVIHGDFLYFRSAMPPSVVVMNPPYSKSLEFVTHAIDLVRPQNGTVAALLRLGWLSSRKRKEFHRANPSDVYVLERRPSFRTTGKTDATEYAWFMWGPGRGGRWFVLDAPVA